MKCQHLRESSALDRQVVTTECKLTFKETEIYNITCGISNFTVEKPIFRLYARRRRGQERVTRRNLLIDYPHELNNFKFSDSELI